MLIPEHIKVSRPSIDSAGRFTVSQSNDIVYVIHGSGNKDDKALRTSSIVRRADSSFTPYRINCSRASTFDNRKDLMWLSLLRLATVSPMNTLICYDNFTHNILSEMIASIIDYDSLPACLIVSEAVWHDITEMPKKTNIRVSHRHSALSSAAFKRPFYCAAIELCKPSSSLPYHLGDFVLWGNTLIHIISDFPCRKSLLQKGECFLLNLNCGEIIIDDKSKFRSDLIMLTRKLQLVICGGYEKLLCT